MPKSPAPSWADADATPSPKVSSEPSYKLLMRLPDLSKPADPGPLGRLRVNWRRAPDGRSGKGWWTGGSAKWLAGAVAAAALIVLAALFTAGRSQRSPSADKRLADVPVKKAEVSSSRSSAPSVVPAGYQTDSVADSAPKGGGPSLLTLRPARLSGSIETVETEVRW